MHFFTVSDFDVNAVLEFHFVEWCAVHNVVRDYHCGICAHLFFAEVVAGEGEFDFFLGSFSRGIVAEDAAEDEVLVFGGDCGRKCLFCFGVEDARVDIGEMQFVDAFGGDVRDFGEFFVFCFEYH